jgi:soluble P-type ATPase
VLNLGKESVIAIGNGQNDVLMLRQAALGIAVLQQEGVFSKLFDCSDITCLTIIDALNLLLNPLRLIATLRK